MLAEIAARAMLGSQNKTPQAGLIRLMCPAADQLRRRQATSGNLWALSCGTKAAVCGLWVKTAPCNTDYQYSQIWSGSHWIFARWSENRKHCIGQDWQNGPKFCVGQFLIKLRLYKSIHKCRYLSVNSHKADRGFGISSNRVCFMYHHITHYLFRAFRLLHTEGLHCSDDL